MRAASSTILMATNRDRERERQRSQELHKDAERAIERATAITAKMSRINDLYRERLEGNRRKA